MDTVLKMKGDNQSYNSNGAETKEALRMIDTYGDNIIANQAET